MLRAFLLCLLVHQSFGLYTSSSPVVILYDSNFKSKVSADAGVWLVEFYAPWCGHCKNLVPAWEESAKALTGIVNVAAVDATEAESLASQFGVRGFPTIFIFGADKDKPKKYEGARTASDITSAALKAATETVKERLHGKKKPESKSDSGDQKASSENNVVELTADNFEEEVLNSDGPWLVEFFAPWCGHCKNLAPEWEKAATELAGNVKLGAVDATVHDSLASDYGVRGYPTIKFFPPGEKAEPIEYDGGRTSDGIVEWSLNKLDDYGVGPQVVEATSEEIMKDSCYSKKICVVSVMPHLIDTGAAGRDAYINTIQAVAKKLRTRPMAFVWIPSGVQTSFEETFGIDFNYPAMVAISEAKLRYARHRGAFSQEALSSFLGDVWSGRQKTIAFNTLPKFKDAEPWDGGDYVYPDEDEE